RVGRPETVALTAASRCRPRRVPERSPTSGGPPYRGESMSTATRSGTLADQRRVALPRRLVVDRDEFTAVDHQRSRNRDHFEDGWGSYGAGAGGGGGASAGARLRKASRFQVGSPREVRQAHSLRIALAKPSSRITLNDESAASRTAPSRRSTSSSVTA